MPKKPLTQALPDMPGHQIRRLHQIAVAIFLQDTQIFGITPMQFAALQAVWNSPGLDQRSLAGMIGLDTSTLGGVVDRLEARDLVKRVASARDRRVKLLELTIAGTALLADMESALKQSQQRILAPLNATQKKQFLTMLTILVNGNNEHSRAPVPLNKSN